MKKNRKILLGVTGSIAAYKAADIIRGLSKKGISTTVVMTKEAERFVTPLTFSCLSGNRVYSGLFEDDPDPWKMPHINLAQEAKAFVIAPATANVIGKLASGIVDDLLSCLAIIVKGPVIIAPAMNTSMYESAIVQENCQRLKQRGCVFIEPVEGELACGVKGNGHLAPVESIIEKVLSQIK